ncbi:MAG: 50S ribosomal protein L10 [Simkaniaceae bacterium]|nr:50S ribosomal protein L10 [Simkaniaceae bacterium]
MRQEKQLLLDSITGAIENASAFILASYQGFDANKTANFRGDLVKNGAEWVVVKKKVFLKAAENCGIQIESKLLQGHVALAVMGEDYVDATKTLYTFSQDNEGLVQILAGHFEGKVVSAGEVEQISKLPTKDEMRAQLLSVLQAPMADTLSVIQSLLTSVMHCLENKSQKES